MDPSLHIRDQGTVETPKWSKIQQSGGKVMTIVFWDAHGLQ